MNSYRAIAASNHRQRGSSLLEVLIAVLVLAIGMLGMAALQAVTLKNSNSSAARSQAVIQTYSLFDTLRLNRELAKSGGYNVSTFTCKQAAAAADDPDDTTDYSVFNAWLGRVQSSLGDDKACARIECDDQSCTVGIKWNDSRGSGGEKALEIETTSGL